MTKPNQNEILRNIFATAMNSPSSALPAPHPVDDEDLLLDWSLGDLSAERHEQLLDHLAACPACRREIAVMVRAGALALPEVAASHVAASLRDADTGLGETVLRGRVWRMRAAFALVTALAASLLLLLGRGLFDSGRTDAGSLIAMAQRDLEQGRPAEAFARMDTYLSGAKDMHTDQQQRATAILESSGYELARSGLVQSNFGQVSDIENRVARRSGGSARLRNLRIQAERGETAEQSLAQRRSLVRDYGYESDGRRQLKNFSIPEITATQRRIEAEITSAIDTYPDAVDLRLNYGQFLLEQNEFERAEAVFAEAVRIAPENVLAQTGLGLALFQQDRPETITRALKPFQKAVELSPSDPAANMNLAVCLMRKKGNPDLH